MDSGLLTIMEGYRSPMCPHQCLACVRSLLPTAAAMHSTPFSERPSNSEISATPSQP